jgi:hypothetical protein
VLRDPHTQNQGPGRSSTLSTLSTSCRPMSSTPHAFCPSRGGGPIFLFPEKPWELSNPDLRLDRLAGVHCGLLPFRFHAICHVPFSTTISPACFIL